jgi:ATP-dependent HslUV protease ATP-binding subunit HslU
MSSMTPQEIVSELDRHIVGQQGQARGGHRAAQPLAPPAGRREAARRDHAQEHPDDRPHRRGQDRDRAPPGAAGRRALHQGRGHQVHRGGLRRQGRGHHHPRPGRRGRQAERERQMRRCARAPRTRPRSASSTCWCRRPRAPAWGIGERRPADSTARQVLRKKLREGSSTTRRSRSTWPTPPALEIMGPRPAWRRWPSSCKGMFSQMGQGGARRAS